ncbi:helix-turn-helix domain-containing protein [Sphaerimonospora thailandensis]|uniref:Helix-turn-helix domain-containing protein n=1 Tax=Sphaerimonospora thailandensis TaxID=795644 RepID=A0A8J3R5J2_9ACTN|nr:helix-turn-helix domain-containing protein [Sphaerimonospora thailandensis]GIH69487.1 hypothetical protein Mth01_17400 [Sphaerimonospora thailandensis]
MQHRTQPDSMMALGEVAAAFGVDPKTVTRWANAGRLDSIRTIGNHRRFYRAQVEAILRGESKPPAPVPHRAGPPLDEWAEAEYRREQADYDDGYDTEGDDAR